MPRRTNKIKIQTGAELWDTLRLNLLRELSEEHAATYNLYEQNSISECLIICPAKAYRNLSFMPIIDKDIILEFWQHNLMIDMERPEALDVEVRQSKRLLKIHRNQLLASCKEKVCFTPVRKGK